MPLGSKTVNRLVPSTEPNAPNPPLNNYSELINQDNNPTESVKVNRKRLETRRRGFEMGCNYPTVKQKLKLT
jgi:hypothetical protein